MPFKNREGNFFTVASEKKPVACQARVINRWMTPGVGGFGTGRATGFDIGRMRIGQTKGFRVALAGANHTIERGQIL